MSYSIMSHYLIRSPLLPIERRNKVKGASSFEGKVAFLEDVLDDEVFVEAIEWGSPALYSQVCKFRDGCNRNDETSIDKLYYSVLKYYLRALYRATPYGLFSGIDIGEIGDCDSVVRVSQNSLSLQIRPDFEVISKLVRDIESDSELDSLLEFRINPNHYLINNRIIIHHLSAVYCEDITSNKTVSLRKSPLLDKIISHFRGQLFTKRDLKRFILSIHPDVSMDLLKSYTNNLVHSEFIISSIRPPFSGEDSISYINAACQKLKNSSKSVELVGKICSSLEKLQRAPIGKRENEIRKMRENLSQKGITFKDALQADLKINYSNNTLSRTSIAELESTLSELLSSITGYTENLTLAKFKSRFLDKYGYFKAVRLPEALDPYSELYEYGPSIQSNFTDSRSKAVKTNQTFSIICDKIETSRNSRIFINSEDLLRLSDGASKFENLPPRTFDYSFNIIKELGQANQYLISPIVGTNGYGMVMGRFAYLLDEEKQQWLKNDAKDIQKRCFDAGYVVVEYHEYPSKARIGNLNQSMNLFDYQICLSTNLSKEAIELDINDFYVGIDKQGFIYVYSESLDKRVIFAFQNMVNPHLLSPIGNFLMAVSHQFPNDLAYFIQVFRTVWKENAEDILGLLRMLDANLNTTGTPNDGNQLENKLSALNEELDDLVSQRASRSITMDDFLSRSTEINNEIINVEGLLQSSIQEQRPKARLDMHSIEAALSDDASFPDGKIEPGFLDRYANRIVKSNNRYIWMLQLVNVQQIMPIQSERQPIAMVTYKSGVPYDIEQEQTGKQDKESAGPDCATICRPQDFFLNMSRTKRKRKLVEWLESCQENQVNVLDEKIPLLSFAVDFVTAYEYQKARGIKIHPGLWKDMRVDIFLVKKEN